MSTAGTSQNIHGAPPSLDDVLAQITTTTNMQQLQTYLKGVAAKDRSVLASTLGSGQDPLTILDPQVNTLGFLYILGSPSKQSHSAARLQSTTTPAPTLLVVENFCEQFDPVQARLAPDRVTSLARGIVRASEASHNPKYALAALFNLLTRYPPHLSYLTTLHPIFLKLCVSTSHFNAALPVLEVPITAVDITLSDLTYNDNLVYHYAGGVAFGALKQWQKAEEFFEICVSAPAQVPAAIQLEAYKKLVLVQLIQYGEIVPPPKYTLPALSRLLKSSPYTTFVKLYPAQLHVLRQWVAKEHDTLTQECNLGLINQAIARAPVWLIKKLTATYLTLGLADIGKEAGIENVEEVREIILSMVDSGEVNGTISADGTVTFADPIPQFTKGDLDRMLVEAQKSSRELHDTERYLNASREYLIKATKHKDDAGWGPEDDNYGPGLAMGGRNSPWAEDLGF